MTLPLNFIQARYTPSFGEYKDNPFIEALPPIMQEIADIKANLIGKVDFNPEDILRSKNERIHLSSQLLHQFSTDYSAYFIRTKNCNINSSRLCRAQYC